MKKIFPGLVYGILFLLFSNRTTAQMAGTYSVPATFSTLATAINSLNMVGVSGPVNILVDAGYSETAPTGGYTITATGTSANPVIFQKNGSGANPLITAYSGGSGTPGSAIQDGVFRLIGCDYLTFDGIDIIDPNTTNPSTMEFGFGLFKASTTNGCLNNLIQNCVITLNKINNVGGSGPAADGSRAIDIVNAISSAHTSALTITSAAGTNSNNKFYSNTLQNCNIGISIIGFATTSPFNFSDTGNDMGGTSPSTGNIIVNFGGGGTASPASGIRTNNQVNLNVSYNSINNTSGGGSGHGTTLRGIFINGTSNVNGANNSVTANTIAVTCTASSNQVSAIECVSGSSVLSTYSTVINNNVIQYCDYISATSGIFNAIINSASTSSLFVNGNVINGINYGGTATAGMIETGSPVYVSVSNNTISSVVRTGNSGTQRGIRITSPSSAIINGNLIDGISWTSLSSTGGSDGVYSLNAAVNVTVANNIIRNFSIPTIGTCNGIRDFSLSGNKIIQNNQVYSFTTTTGGTGGANFNGIFCSSGTINISGNDIHDLISTGTPGGSSGNIYGLQITGGTSIDSYKNKIYNLSSNAYSPLVYGIFINGGTTNTIYNNIIGNILSPYANGSAPIAGIYISGGSTSNLYYNTVYLNASSSSALFGSNALYATTAASLYLRNNIFINNSISSGFGRTVAYRRSSTTLTSYSTASDNNIFYAGSPGLSNLLFYDGTNSYQTLTSMQTAISPREGLSYTENTTFLSLMGNSVNFLHIAPTVFSFSESGGVNIAGITDDYDSNVRQGNPGYTGSGTAPDIGADEFDSNLAGCSSVSSGVIVMPAISKCSGQTVSLNASGLTTGSGIINQWQISTTSGGPYTNVSGGSGANTANYTSAALGTGVYYYVLLTTCTLTSLSAVSNEATVTVNAIPTVSATSNSPVCTGNMLNFTGSSDIATSYLWTGPNAFASSAQNPTVSNAQTNAAGLYTLVVSAAGCSATAITTSITVNSTSLTIISPGVSCSGSSIVLTTSGTATSYTWSTGANTNSISIAPLAPATSTVYTVSGTGTNNCVSTASTTIVVNPLPVVTASASTSTICAGSTTSLNASGATTYSWTSGGTSSVEVVNPSSTTSYTVTGTDGNGCSNTGTIGVTVNALPSVSLTTAQTTLCVNGPTVTLTGSPSGGVYTGTNVSSAGVFTPGPVSGTFTPAYSYTDAITGCSNATSLNIVVSLCTGLSKNSGLADLSVYPNPTRGEFVIELNNGQNKTIEINDLTGRVVSTESSTNDKIHLNISLLANGVYFVKISSNKATNIIKIVKQ